MSEQVVELSVEDVAELAGLTPKAVRSLEVARTQLRGQARRVLGLGYTLEWEMENAGRVINLRLYAPESDAQAAMRATLHRALTQYGLPLAACGSLPHDALRTGGAPADKRGFTLAQLTASTSDVVATEVFLMLQRLKAAGAWPSLPPKSE